jgi:hypothetical protein
MGRWRQQHTATRLADGTVLITGGCYYDCFDVALASAEIYNPATGTFAATGSMKGSRAAHTATLLQNGTVLVVGDFNNYDDYSAEIYDPSARTFAQTGSIGGFRIKHSATLLLDGTVFISGSAYNNAEVYDPNTASFISTDRRALPRRAHTATRLLDGRVLVTGGIIAGSSFTDSAQVYDFAKGGFIATGSMTEPRTGHTATRLSDGRVLIAGGLDDNNNAIASAEIYNPATGTFTATGSMGIPRFGHTATLLQDGRVLVAGGANYEILSSAVLYDPATGTWSATGDLYFARYYHTATRLSNSKVLIAGGYQAGAEVYDPAKGTFTLTGSMGWQRTNHTATRLSDGKVLVAGGVQGYNLASELYNPATGTFVLTDPMSQPRTGHADVLLGSGDVAVLIGGGSNTSIASSGVDVYDSATQDFAKIGDTIGEYAYHTVTLLRGNEVLVVGDNLDASAERGRVVVANTFTGTLTVPTGWVTTATPTVTFTASTTGTLLADGSVNDGPWVAAQPNTPTTTTLPTTADGLDRPVVLRLRDAEGREATVVRGTVDVDTTAPTSTMQALPATSPATFIVRWSGSDATSGVEGYDVEVRRSGTTDWVPVVTDTPALSTSFTGEQGVTYEFRVRARDVAGNVEAWPSSGEIRTQVDTVAPTATLEINGGALATTTRDVLLTLAADDTQSPVTEMRVWQDGGTTGTWQPYETESTLQLVGANGVKTVRAEVRDSAGNVSPVATASIRLDTAAGTDYELSIDDGALWTNTTSVTLRVGAPGGTSEMRVSNDGGFAGAPWQPFDTRPEWTISTFGDYTIPRTVYVRVRDTDGQTLGIVQDDIIYDPLPPSGSVSITSVQSDEVEVALRATDQAQLSGVAEMRVSANAQFTGAAWQPYATSATVPRAGTGSVQVYAQFRDGAGNRSTVVSATPAQTATPTRTVSPTRTPTPTRTGTVEPTASDTVTATTTRTATPSPTRTGTVEPTKTGTVEPTASGTVTTTPTRTGTVEPTRTGTVEPTTTGTVSPSPTTQPTDKRVFLPLVQH